MVCLLAAPLLPPPTHRALQSPAGAWWQGQGRGSPTGTAARRHRGRTQPTRRARLPLALPQAVPAPRHPQQPRDVTLAAEHDHDVCLAAVDLGEGEGGHVTPHLESSLEGVVYHSTVQVGGVIHHPAGKAAAQHRSAGRCGRRGPAPGTWQGRAPAPRGRAAPRSQAGQLAAALGPGSEALLGIGEQMLPAVPCQAPAGWQQGKGPCACLHPLRVRCPVAMWLPSPGAETHRYVRSM